MLALATVVETPAYLSKAERLLSEAERADIVDMLATNPTHGVRITGAPGIRKARIGLEGRGKRGGGRIIYWFHSQAYPEVLLWVFAKNEASDLTANQLRALSCEASALVEDFGGRR